MRSVWFGNDLQNAPRGPKGLYVPAEDLGPIVALNDADLEACKRFAAALPELRRLEAAATPGPWEPKTGDNETREDYPDRFWAEGPSSYADIYALDYENQRQAGYEASANDAALICALRNIFVADEIRERSEPLLAEPEAKETKMKFRKKPVIIEAFQMTRERRQDNRDWPEWMNRAWNLEREEPGSLYPTEIGTSDGTLSIGTLEGQHLVSWGDWIIQGVKGELYPCKPGIFAATYEPVQP